MNYHSLFDILGSVTIVNIYFVIDSECLLKLKKRCNKTLSNIFLFILLRMILLVYYILFINYMIRMAGVINNQLTER